MSAKVCIEFAQPYESSNSETNDAIGFAALNSLIKKLRDEQTDFSLVALVDDYSHEGTAGFDFDAYGNWLHEKGFDADLVARESEIKASCETVLSMMETSKLSPELQLIIQKDPYVSPLFIATWCLMRLGYIQQDTISPELQAEKLVNILPDTFKPDEDHSLEIIRATPFAKAADSIEYIFIAY